MNRNNPVVQALLGNKNNQGNQPQQNDNNECVDEHGKKAKTSTVEGCAANKHGGVHSCESQGKEIIWAKVQQKTSLYPCNYQKNPIEYDHAIADGGVFTYDKTTITVAGGCRANFLICYKGMCILVSSSFSSFSSLNKEINLFSALIKCLSGQLYNGQVLIN